MKALVLGGFGFIGTSVVDMLEKNGYQVIIGTRSINKNTPNVMSVRMEEMTQSTQWVELLRNQDLKKGDVVVNCVGILRERRRLSVAGVKSNMESYLNVHTLAPAALSKACKSLAIRFVHISALGLSAESKSEFINSKFRGEQAILKEGGIAVRAPLLDSENKTLGFGAKWFRRVARWPIHFVMNAPDGLVSPIKVNELAEAISSVCSIPNSESVGVYEFGSRQALTIEQYLQALRSEYSNSSALVIKLPYCLVRLISHIFDVIHFSPLSFGHVELMKGKNVPTVNQLNALLGREATRIGVVGSKSNNCVGECDAIV